MFTERSDLPATDQQTRLRFVCRFLGVLAFDYGLRFYGGAPVTDEAQDYYVQERNTAPFPPSDR
jgi:hypothetical protein